MRRIIVFIAAIFSLIACSNQNDNNPEANTLLHMMSKEGDFNDDTMLQSLSSGVIFADCSYYKHNESWMTSLQLVGPPIFHTSIYDGTSIKLLLDENSFDDGSDWMMFLAETKIKYYKEIKCRYDRDSNTLISVDDGSVVMQIGYYKNDTFVILSNSGRMLTYCNTHNKDIEQAMADRISYEEAVALYKEAGYDESEVR